MKMVASTASLKVSKDARRQHRQPVDVVLSYRTVDQFYCDIATNVSTGGVFVKTPHPLRVGTPLRISFVIPQFGTRVEANGLVVHQGNPECPGMGIKFSEIDQRALKAINELIQHEHCVDSAVGDPVALKACDEQVQAPKGKQVKKPKKAVPAAKKAKSTGKAAVKKTSKAAAKKR